ncbi:MAG: hypothetical protein RLZZ200_1964 [Pseudomonadota bacterium]|jgi:cobalt-zinc-cadmium efflux system outer membrane protein
METRLLLRGAQCALLWCACVAARAAEAPPFEELFRQVQATAPRFAEIDATVRAAEGRARQSAAWANPSLAVEVENFSGSGAAGGPSRQGQTTFSLSEPLEIWGQRTARMAAGRAESDATRIRARQDLVDFAAELALGYALAESQQLRAELLTADLDRTHEDLRRARALVAAGREGELRVMQAEASAAAARADVEVARAESAASLSRLATLSGSPEPYSGLGGSLLLRKLPMRDPEPPADAPSVLAAEAERKAAESRVQVQRKNALPALGVSLGVRRFPSESATSLVAGVSLSLPVFDRNSGAIAAARADQSAAEARLAATRLEAHAGWNIAVAEVGSAAIRLDAAVQGQQAASEAYRLARIGYDAGRTPLLELLTTRRALTESELRIIDARFASLRAQVQLSRLAGRIPFGGSRE